MRSFALTLLCVLTIYLAVARDTGLIFVNNEKTKNIIVIDPQSWSTTSIRTTCVSTPTQPPRLLRATWSHRTSSRLLSLVPTTAIEYLAGRHP
jgi:hypothetical protein